MALYFFFGLSCVLLAPIFGMPEVELNQGYRPHGRVFAGYVDF